MNSDLLRRLPLGVQTRLRSLLIPDEAHLVFQMLKGRPDSRIMLDVGACHGDAFGPFADDGWTVYAFEPDPINRGRLTARWSEVAAVHIDPRAVSNRIEDGVPFYRSAISAGISGLSSFHPTHEAQGTVDTVTLGTFFRHHRITAVDFLKIDTEGYDLFVLQGVPWQDVAPRVVLCEFEDRKTRPLGYRFEDLAAYLLDRGYEVLVSEWHPIVAYGTAHRWRRFEPYPCTLRDPQAWGNLIAVRDPEDYSRLCSLASRAGGPWRLGTMMRQAVHTMVS